ncbi:MAG: phosphoribosylformylglycinamidine synthase subunit PurS [Deltaproteobacteria bacterium]|jgi:phosphoribosylformylglycinamidine synthase|nr:phosphoribosylformylglycinamidine synthase subunit PurS [Deltaproteobacteria bacterium]
MLRRLEIRLRPQITDSVGLKTARAIADSLDLAVASAAIRRVFTIAGLSDGQFETAIREGLLHDPVLQEADAAAGATDADWIIEVGFRPGVTDNEGRTARDTLALALGIADKNSLAVYTATQYHLRSSKGKALDEDDVARIARDFLANELIQRYRIKSGAAWYLEPGFAPLAAKVSGEALSEVAVVALSAMSDEELLSFSRDNTLALSLEELLAIKAHYAEAAVRAERAKAGLPPDPTDAEIEVLAQTWSEHCKHKIFAAKISYENRETGEKETIDSLYKTYIKGSTQTIRKRLGDKDFCKSVFTDNAGVVGFTEGYDAAIKVETHNSPSALDPYGGALTGIVGVNRDLMGVGQGASMVCNMDVFCFASPFYNEELPPRLLHPRRVMEGVREGVEHGGNKSGIPTVNGSVVFEPRFLGKPLVYCGTVGLLPAMVNGRPGHQKKARVGDAVVMAGGRIGKDGIHGATFSSEELHEESPATAVQIGDPITQRKLYDFILRARDLGLFSAITDNGAGGLSSSVGEMAGDTGGCRIDLARAPVKYDGLRPWEILLSEAQERMTLAVPPEKLDEFLALAGRMDVEASPLGEFTDSGYFQVEYAGKPVARLAMDFMHDGVPQMELRAVWDPRFARLADREATLEVEAGRQGDFLKTMLGRLNICSKEYLIRQYDHEVKGGSVIKPLVGVKRDGPGDAAVLRPLLDREEGLVLSHGICPKFSDFDTYWMMANAIDEAVRGAAAVGADPKRLAGVDNFCWCDPVQSERTPDGHYKLAQLVRANQALAAFCTAFGVPCISGKDSMKNDYTGGGVKISIPPTVLFTVLGIIPKAGRAVSSDFKGRGESIYLLGRTARELAGSEAASELGVNAGNAPQVDAPSAGARYAALHEAIMRRLVSACHDLSDGGLGVALAEMALGGRCGAEADLALVPAEAMNPTELLYSESASRLLVTVPDICREEFETLFAGQVFARIGETLGGPRLLVKHGGTQVLDEHVDDLAAAFKATLHW